MSRTTNTNKKGYTANILSLFQEKQQATDCCTSISGVTSVGLVGSPIFDISNSPITTEGDLNLGLALQPANTFFAGPESGSDGTPTFRPLVASDIPPPLVNNGLSVNNTSIGWGQPVGTPGNPAAFLEDREVPLDGFTVNFTNGASALSMDMLGFANSFRLISNTYLTIESLVDYIIFENDFGTTANDFTTLQFSGKQGLLLNFSGVISGFNFGSGVTQEPFLITTTPSNNGSGPAGDIIISTGRIQQTQYTTQTGFLYNIILQPSGGGSVLVNALTANPSAAFQVDSTTQGILFPRMTTTQKNAIVTPAAGLVVFDTTLAKLAVYSGTAWQTITSV